MEDRYGRQGQRSFEIHELGEEENYDNTEPSQQFLLEEKLTFQEKISGDIFFHDISEEVIVNLDQTLLSYVSPGNALLTLKMLKPFLLNFR